MKKMKKELLLDIEKRLDGVTAEEAVVLKNNGVVRHGVSIKKNGSNIVPTIYVDGVDPDKIVDFVVNAYLSSKTPDIDASVLNSKESILKAVFPQFINAKKNVALCAELVHVPYLDMEVIFRVDIGDATSLVRKDQADKLDISSKELFDAALKNIEGRGEIYSLGEMLGIGADSAPVCVITNRRKEFGASMILDEDVVKMAALRYGGRFYALPSSIHEMLVVPYGEYNVSDLRLMVTTINAEIMKDEEILTDNVYVYENGKFEVA